MNLPPEFISNIQNAFHEDPLALLPGTELASQSTRREFGLQTRFRVFPQCQGTYRFSGAPFSSVESGEFVVATNSLTFAQ